MSINKSSYLSVCFTSLRGKKFFSHINLRNNKIDDDAIDFVVDFLNHSKSITRITLLSNKLSRRIRLELVEQTLTQNQKKNIFVNSNASVQTKPQPKPEQLEHKTVPNNSPRTEIVTTKFNTGRPREWTPDLGDLYEAAKSGNLTETKRLTANEAKCGYSISSFR